jgi:hypothetical protein
MSGVGHWRPRARRRGLVVVRLPDETLVYDLKRARAFCLQGRLARLWRWSDGRTTVAALVRRARRRLGPGAEHADPALVVGALNRLRRARLLEAPEPGPRLSSAERRAFLARAAALGGLALVEVAAPTAADAATCVTRQQCSAQGRDCGGQACCDGSGFCQGPGNSPCRCR